MISHKIFTSPLLKNHDYTGQQNKAKNRIQLLAANTEVLLFTASVSVESFNLSASKSRKKTKRNAELLP
jgi:hypothetical protein